MAAQTLQLSLFQLELIRDSIAGFDENKKMIHLPTSAGERVPVALPLSILNSLVEDFKHSDENEVQSIIYETQEEVGDLLHVTLRWGTEHPKSVQYTIHTDEYHLE